MLVKFHSSTSGEILMFAETARQFVELIGKAAQAKGVVTYEQLPDAIARIEAAIARAKTAEKAGAAAADTGNDEAPAIGLVQRFVPMLELLQRTRDDEGYVLWEAPADFGAGR